MAAKDTMTSNPAPASELDRDVIGSALGYGAGDRGHGGGADGARAWSAIDVREVCVSTQDEVRRLAQAAGPDDCGWWLAVADRQTGGRGRGGASWYSPAATALHLSLGCRLDLPLEMLPRASIVVGLAVVHLLDQICGVTVGLKWPNDLLIRGADGRWRKVGGVICIAEPVPGQPTGAATAWFAGIGLNVSTPATSFPAALRGHATSLDRPVDGPIDRSFLAGRIARAVRSAVRAWQKAGGALDLAAIDAALCFRGEVVDLDVGAPAVTRAVLDGVDSSGWLRVSPLDRAGHRDEGAQSVLCRPLAIVAAASDPPWCAAPKMASPGGCQENDPRREPST